MPGTEFYTEYAEIWQRSTLVEIYREQDRLLRAAMHLERQRCRPQTFLSMIDKKLEILEGIANGKCPNLQIYC